MRSRAVTVGVVAASLFVVPVQAGAEPRESCRILVDAKGDAEGSGGAGVVWMKSTDIVSADVASTREYLTAAVRVADLSARESEAQTMGLSLQFDLNGTRFGFQSVESTTRIEYTVWRKPSRGGEWQWVSWATGAWNDDDSAVYITLSLARMHIGQDSRFVATNLAATSFYGYDAAVIAGVARSDTSTGKGSYRLGSPSCSPAPVEPCRDPRPAGKPPQDMCPGGG